MTGEKCKKTEKRSETIITTALILLCLAFMTLLLFHAGVLDEHAARHEQARQIMRINTNAPSSHPLIYFTPNYSPAERQERAKSLFAPEVRDTLTFPLFGGEILIPDNIKSGVNPIVHIISEDHMVFEYTATVYFPTRTKQHLQGRRTVRFDFVRIDDKWYIREIE